MEDVTPFTSGAGAVHRSQVVITGKVSEVRGLDRMTLSDEGTRAFQTLGSGSGKPAATAEKEYVTSLAQS
jgi:hypothetical protein